MAFLPKDFIVPALLETKKFRIRPITIHDAFKDYDAVMSSRKELWEHFGEAWGWPTEDLTIEQDIIDLGWHQKEFQLRSSFDYAVMSLDEKRLLGCVYIDPCSLEEYGAEVYYWVRSDELTNGLEESLSTTVRKWIATDWPFKNVAYPGRDISWESWDELDA